MIDHSQWETIGRDDYDSVYRNLLKNNVLLSKLPEAALPRADRVAYETVVRRSTFERGD